LAATKPIRQCDIYPKLGTHRVVPNERSATLDEEIHFETLAGEWAQMNLAMPAIGVRNLEALNVAGVIFLRKRQLRLHRS
jgi:hypothetical protein